MTINQKGWIYLSERYKTILVSKINSNLFTHFFISLDLFNSIVNSIRSDKNGGIYLCIENSIYHHKYSQTTELSLYDYNNRLLGVDNDGNAILRYANSLSLYLPSLKKIINISSPSFISSNFICNITIKVNKWLWNLVVLEFIYQMIMVKIGKTSVRELVLLMELR